jgi:hypothetical protein
MAILSCLVLSCGSTSYEPDRDGRGGSGVVYFNSFESPGDVVGWTGITEEMLVKDPAPRGGEQSLHIGGGCSQPTAHIVLPVQTDGANYRLSCWGKLLDKSQRGSLILAINTGGDRRRETTLVVDRENWGLYKSEGTLYCPAEHELRLEIMIGGFVPASMLVDSIRIERIE